MTNSISGSTPNPLFRPASPNPQDFSATAPAPAAPAPTPAGPTTPGDASQAQAGAGALPGSHDLGDLTIPGQSASCEAPAIPSIPTRPSTPPQLAHGRQFSSVGDPHETSGDKGKFDNMLVGEFVKLRSASGDFELQTRQNGGEVWNAEKGKLEMATVNQQVGMRMGKDLIQFDASQCTLAIDGVNVPIYPVGGPGVLMVGQSFALPSGGTCTRLSDYEFEFTSAAGDKVKITQTGVGSLDVEGEVAATRQDGEVKGSLGRLDYDRNALNDLETRDGRFMGWDERGIELFLESWRVDNGFESLLPA